MAPATLHLESTPTAAGLDRIAREVSHAPDVPPELAKWLAPLLERSARVLRQGAGQALALLREGHSAAAAITAVQVPIAGCVYDLVTPLMLAQVFPSLQELVAGVDEAREEALRRFHGEHIDAILEDVAYALDGLRAASELLVRAAAERDAQRVQDLQPEFLSRCIVRQARLLVGLEILDQIAAEGSMEDHAFGLPVAEDLARTGREHFEDARRALGYERKPAAVVVAGHESDEPTEADAETAEYFKEALERRASAG